MVNATRRKPTHQVSDSEDDDSDQPSPAKRVKTERLSMSQRISMNRASAANSARDGESDDSSEAHSERYDVDEESEGAGAGEDEISDAELMRLHAAQKERRKAMEGGISEAGVIKHISLVDFMCHRHFTVDFAPKMNFLVGHNGSGKSAILTAIAIALGGKAAATGRGNGLKDLIREAADRAIITLTLSNQGPYAYKPNDKDYSPNVVIERIISKSGSSEWRFKASRDGKILSKKKSELDAIRTAFGIDVDQPMTILTQDQARSFLTNVNDEQLYKFFLNSTQLQAISDNLDSGKRNLDAIEHTIYRLERDLPELSRNAEELLKRIQANDRIEKQTALAKELKREQAWALVIHKENLRKEFQDEMDEADEKLRKIEDTIADLQREIEPLDAQIDRQTAVIAEFTESRKTIENDRRQARAEHESRKTMLIDLDVSKCQSIADLQAMLTENRKLVASAEKEIAGHERKIAAQRELLNRGRDAAQLKAESDLIKVEELEHKLRRELPKKEEAVEHFAKLRDEANKRLEDAQNRAGAINGEISRLRDSLAGLDNQRTNRLAAFGTNINAVLTEIDKARWHVAKPVGPLGQYIELKDFQYKDLMESILGSLMCAFAVQDRRDRIQLQKILEDCQRRGYKPGHLPTNSRPILPQIVQNSNDMFDYSSGDQSMYGETLLTKLKITDEYVKRILINMVSIERNFIAPDMEKASSEIGRLVGIGLRRPVVYSALPHPMRQEGRPNGRDSQPVAQFNGNRMFTRDIAQEYDEMRSQMDIRTVKRNEVDHECAELRRERDEHQTAWSKATADLKRVRSALPVAEEQLAQIRAKLNAQPSDEITAQEDLKRTKLTAQRQVDSLTEERVGLAADTATARAKYEALQERLENFAPERNEHQTRLHELTLKRGQKKNNMTHYQDAERQAKQKRATAQAGYERADESVKDWTARIMPSHPERFETNRDVKTIKAEEATLLKAIAEAEKRQGINIVQLKEQYVKAQNDATSAAKRGKEMKRMTATIAMHLRNRARFWIDLRRSVCVQVKSAFIAYVDHRGFEGRLNFDHPNGRLRMIVQPDPSKEQDVTAAKLLKSVKNLSGGEKSFSTVSFLLAMWEVTSSTLRCLDEFDVFLDSINRGLAVKLLIEGAKQSDGKQYILISPQSMGSIKVDGAHSRIIKMPEPIRNQGTL